MSGEYIQSNDNQSYWKQLKAYYLASSPVFEEISKEEYEKIERSEREDSDNHLNFERLGEDTKVVDLDYYKYLPDEKIAHRVHIVDINGNREDHYFIINSF